MLFNSQFFIFVFLPTALALYFAIGKVSRVWALRWIIVASLIFYAWWRPANVLIIVPAMLINYGVARSIVNFRDSEQPGMARLVLAIGIVFNILFLGYFKYANFALTTANDLFDTDFTLRNIVLPLGISFITFQKIAFLIDVHGKRVESFRFHDFCSFVLFFPQLIAGPIVHYREMMPQFHGATCRWDSENVSVGVSLFLIGLFKKVVLADSIAPMVSSIYAGADAGVGISLLPAWLAAVGFTFQIYFDFSGYSDMALGAARMFGIRLPLNFNSPLKATNIIDFWLRWHVSLTRFLTAYVYNPIALSLTRRRMKGGRRGLGGAQTSIGAFLQLLVFPTLFTMFISGLWHGAGYLFVLWGILHGIYLCVNHAFRTFVHSRWSDSDSYDRIMRPLGFVLTFGGVAFSMVLFRSTSVDSALNILAGMIGINGVEVPMAILERLPDSVRQLWFITDTGDIAHWDNVLPLAAWIIGLAPIVFLAPNTLQVLEHYRPTVDFAPKLTNRYPMGVDVRWRTSPAWAVFIALVGWFAVQNIGGYSEFLYWQF